MKIGVGSALRLGNLLRGKAVIADFETAEGQSAIQETLRKRFAGAKPSEFVQRSVDNLREVSAIVDTKAPGDAAAFKAWLRGISQKVAKASVEGGFLGVGGVRVSDAEKATLADIAKALAHNRCLRELSDNRKGLSEVTALESERPVLGAVDMNDVTWV